MPFDSSSRGPTPTRSVDEPLNTAVQPCESRVLVGNVFLWQTDRSTHGYWDENDGEVSLPMCPRPRQMYSPAGQRAFR